VYSPSQVTIDRVDSIASGPASTLNLAYNVASNVSGATFECLLSIDGSVAHDWASCTSTPSYAETLPDCSLKSATFKVRATSGGVTDATPFSIDSWAYFDDCFCNNVGC
jgi:hypothetical protein